MIYNQKLLDRYLYQIGMQDPRYTSFVQAQAIDAIKLSKNTVFSELLQANVDRMEQYNYFWDLYFGAHWYSVSNENLNPLKANYAYSIVNKHVAFLMNKGFRASSRFPEIEKYLNKMWDKNDATKESNNFGTLLAIQGGVTGDTVFDMRVTNDERGEEYLSLQVQPSTHFFPVVSEGKQLGILIYGEWSKVTAENYGFPQYESSYKGYYYKEDGTIYSIVDEKVIDTEFSPLRMSPVVHIKNMPLPTSVHGISDLVNMFDLNKSIDNTLTDIQAVIDYQAQPVTILKGARIGDLTRGANRIWTLPKDAEISNLKLEGEMTASSEQIKRLKEIISEVTNVPESALGKTQNISNTSAVALAITFLPLYETMEFKRTTYGIGFLKAHRYAISVAILRNWLDVNLIIKNALATWNKEFAEADEDIKQRNYPFAKRIKEGFDYNTLSAFYSGEVPSEIFDSSIIWFPPLPRDETLDNQDILANVNAKMWSRRYGRKKQGMPDSINLLLEQETKNDAIFDAELANKTVVTDEKIKTGLEGNPVVKGNQESLRQEKQKSGGS